MAAYKTQPAQLHDTAYPAFSTPAYQTQQPETTTSPLGTMNFNTAPSSGQYITPTSPTHSQAHQAHGTHPVQAATHAPVNILSCGPTAGTAGTRVELKVSSQYDLMAMSPPAPYVWLSFGAHKCHADVVKEAVIQDGLTYVVSAEAPQFMSTGCASPADVSLTVVIENTSGEELARVPVARSFTYQDQVAAPAEGDASSVHDIVHKSTPASPGQVDAHETPTHASPSQTHQSHAAHQSHQSHAVHQTHQHHNQTHTQTQLPVDTGANSFAYPAPGVDASAVNAQAHAQNGFVGSQYGQDNNGMLGAYRSASFSDSFNRGTGQQPLRAPASTGWPATSNYGSLGHQGPQHQPHASHSAHNPHDRYNMRSHSLAHVHGASGMARPPLSAPLSATSAGNAPALIRTSTITAGHGSVNGMGGGYGSGHWSGYTSKAVLNIHGNLDLMAQEWTPEEWNNRRRIVMFRKKQNGSHLEARFQPVPINERPPNSICISCIYWAEKQECFVTSVDTINLLEQLVLAAPNRFTVEEKNRIRRNLEGFRPFTVSKAKNESEEFFKLIMGFGAPKPRTIEKDVKVFPWKILGQALKKIIGKYSANPSAQAMSAAPQHLLTPVTMSPSYPGLPPTPGSLSTGADPSLGSAGYVGMTNGAESLASPRSLSGASWVSYAGNAAATTGRPMSPSGQHKPGSPGSAHMRLGMPSAYDARGSNASNASAHSYGHHTHHTQNFNSPLALPTTASSSGGISSTAAPNHRWDNYSVASGSAPGSYAANHAPAAHAPQPHTHQGHNLYSTGYAEAVPRT